MVQLFTQPPEVAPVPVDTRIGSRQQAGQGFLGALAQGVTAGVKTFDASQRPEDEIQIDPDLHDAIIGVNPPEFEQLNRGLGREATKQQQTGKSRLPNILAHIRQARAAGLSPEVVEHTVRKATGSSVFGLELLIEKEDEDTTTTRDRILSQLEKDNNLFTDDGRAVTSLEEPELMQFAFDREQERERLSRTQEQYQLLTTREGITTQHLKDNYRQEVIPAKVQALDKRISNFLRSNEQWFPKERVEIIPGVSETRLRVDELPLEDIVDEQTGQIIAPGLNTLKQTISDMRAEFQQAVNQDLLFRISDAERAEIMRMADSYLDTALGVLNGTDSLENLTAQAELSGAIERDRFYRNNPLAEGAITVANEMSRIMESLGPEGIALRQDLAERYFLPMTKGVVINGVDLMGQLGITDPADQKEMFRDMADYLRSPVNDLKTKGVALRHLLANMGRSGVDNAEVYHAMLEMMADPDGFQRVVDTMAGLPKRRLVNEAKEGFINFQEAFRAEFENELQRSLKRPVFQEEATTAEERSVISLTGIQLSGQEFTRDVPLERFISDNLFQPSGVQPGLNAESLKDLPEGQRIRVVAAYRELLKEFSDDLELIDQVQNNLFTTREQQQFFQPFRPDEEQEAQEE